MAKAKVVFYALPNDVNLNHDVHKVEYAKLGDDFSSVADEGMNSNLTKLFTDNKLPVPTMPASRKADEVKAAGGSGQNFLTSSGSHSVILEGSEITNSGEEEIDAFHEVFGHGIQTAKRTTDAINNRHAIQTENLVRRVYGLSNKGMDLTIRLGIIKPECTSKN